MTKDLIVIKVGSNILIDQNETINQKIFDNISNQINEIKKTHNMNVVLISSGAVGLGKRKLPTFTSKGEKTLEKQFFASIGQPYLMKEYDKAFAKYGITISQALLTRSDFADREKYLSMRNVLNLILENDILPIINENDVLSPEELDFSDNDQLGAYVAGMLGAKYLVLISNIDGLYTMHPSKPGAKLIQYVDCINDEILKYAEEEKSSMGTGGMKSKLNTAQLMMNLGVNMFIVNGNQDSCLIKIIKGEKVGTQFEAQKCNISGIRRWLGSGACPKGKIKLCAIIQELLQQKKRLSILLSGVQGVYGDFEKGDVIEVIGDDKKMIGYGISKYDSDELKTLYQKTDEQKNNYIVIHTDYFMHS